MDLALALALANPGGTHAPARLEGNYVFIRIFS
jgi:hypothetical protein